MVILLLFWDRQDLERGKERNATMSNLKCQIKEEDIGLRHLRKHANYKKGLPSRLFVKGGRLVSKGWTFKISEIALVKQ